MKNVRPAIPVFLIAVCAIQVQGLPFARDLDLKEIGWEWMTPAIYPTTEENNQRDVRIPPARRGGSWIEMTPTKIVFRKTNMFVDDIDPGLRPNTRDTLYQYAWFLSRVTPDTLLNTLGFNEVPQRNALSTVLGEVIRARFRRTFNDGIIVLFCWMLEEHAPETELALTGILATIQEIQNLRAESIFRKASDVLGTTLHRYFLRSRDPIPIPAWSQVIAPLIDQLINGETNAAKGIVTALISHCKEFQRLTKMSSADQVNIVEMVLEDVTNYKQFLNFVIHVRESNGE